MAMILAGGEGRRLFPLTLDRAKPAVPFGGKYRIIDFALNNFVNSGIYQIKILTQFKSDSLNKHITRGWPMSPVYGQYIDLVPAQMRTGGTWYRGTADAIYQNINLIEDENPELVCVFGGDHIYKMDIRQMLQFHHDNKAELSIAAVEVPVEKASAFGVIEVDQTGRIVGWQEKPDVPREIPGKPGWVLASMGNYVFNREVILEELQQDAALDVSEHDFGKDVIRSMLSRRNVFAYNFSENQVPGALPHEVGYWRDVGDIDSYWEANMDLIDVSPLFNLYNRYWPIRTFSYQAPPSKFVFDEQERRGYATDSIVSDGCIISGGRLIRGVLSPYCKINSFSVVEESILMHGVSIGRYAHVRRAILDKDVHVPPGYRIGFDSKEDIERGFYVSPGGITIVPKGAQLL